MKRTLILILVASIMVSTQAYVFMNDDLQPDFSGKMTYDGGPTKVKLIFDNYDSGIEKIEMARPDNPYDQLFHWAGKKKRPYIGQRSKVKLWLRLRKSLLNHI